jgi:hypothetical protein
VRWTVPSSTGEGSITVSTPSPSLRRGLGSALPRLPKETGGSPKLRPCSMAVARQGCRLTVRCSTSELLGNKREHPTRYGLASAAGASAFGGSGGRGGGGTGPPDGHWHTGSTPFHAQQRTPSAEPGGLAMSTHSEGGLGGTGGGVGPGHARRSSTRSMVAEPLQPAVDKQATVQDTTGHSEPEKMSNASVVAGEERTEAGSSPPQRTYESNADRWWACWRASNNPYPAAAVGANRTATKFRGERTPFPT